MCEDKYHDAQLHRSQVADHYDRQGQGSEINVSSLVLPAFLMSFVTSLTARLIGGSGNVQQPSTDKCAKLANTGIEDNKSNISVSTPK